MSVDGFCFSPDPDAVQIYQRILGMGEVFRFNEELKELIAGKFSVEPSSGPDDIAVFVDIIIRSFGDRQVPAHFDLAQGSLRKLSKNWLTQRSVSRDTVLLLGFGLGLSLDEAETLLTKGLGDTRLNPKDPFETLCWYCFKNGLEYHEFSRLRQAVKQSNALGKDGFVPNDSTEKFRSLRDQITSEAELIEFIRTISVIHDWRAQSYSARKAFMQMYMACGAILAPDETRISPDTDGDYAARCAATVEKELYSATPKDENYNLKPLKNTRLGRILNVPRLSRQRMRDILNLQTRINRADLLTLSFLLTSLTFVLSDGGSLKSGFIEHADANLIRCGMCALDRRRPYDALLTLCTDTVDPLETFNDVTDLAYKDMAVS
ncbi:MAG: hypothetical protein II875_09030 [Clostridia bacterium]|nr:hypothetical protein [Clostridia bacterium]